GDLQPLQQAGPRRSPLPPDARFPSGSRSPYRARPADLQAGAPPSPPRLVPLPPRTPRLGTRLRRRRNRPVRHLGQPDPRTTRPAIAPAPVTEGNEPPLPGPAPRCSGGCP